MADWKTQQDIEQNGVRTGPYADIMDLPHPVSEKHPPMPLANRAAQFAPFAALTGFHEEIERTAREWNAQKEKH